MAGGFDRARGDFGDNRGILHRDLSMSQGLLVADRETKRGDLGLVHYDNMCRAIAECYRVDEVKDLRDKAKALEIYAQQARNLDAERKACEIRIRAERRAGELLRGMKDSGQRDSGGGGDRKSQSRSTTVIQDQIPAPLPATLKDLNITRDQSSKWQQLAAVPAEEFERALTGGIPKPTTEGIIHASQPRESRPSVPAIDTDALWIWGRLRDFERNGIFNRELDGLLDAMTDSMRDDCNRILPRVLAWLALKEIKHGNGRAA
jgi:hypothetical protein